MIYFLISLIIVSFVIIVYACLPLRKAVWIRLSRRWKREAAVHSFPVERVKEEERNLFISYTVFRDNADIAWLEKNPDPPPELFTELPYGTVVVVNTKRLGDFIDILPELRSCITLVVGGDTVCPSTFEYRSLVESDKIIHIFLQNFDWDPCLLDKRVTPIPVGLNFHKLDPGSDNRGIDMGLPAVPGNQQLTLKAIRDGIPPFQDKPLKVYANFHLNMDTFLRSRESKKRFMARKEALDSLKGNSAVFFEKRQRPRNSVWKRHKDFSFEVSPHGNGLDCHRTWEALLLKSVPIVQTSTLDPLYQKFPIVIVNSWDEITPENLLMWKEEMVSRHCTQIDERLYSRWWLNHFNSFKKRTGETN